MAAKSYTTEQIVHKLRESWVLISQGKSVVRASRKIRATERAYCRWRKEFGGLKSDQAKWLKDLEKENARLKRFLADAELDKAILREAANPNF